MTSSSKPRAVFYGRYSTGKQDMQMQIDAARRFCTDRGYDLIDTESYRDDAVSATRVGFRSRKGLMKLLGDIDNNKFDLVVAYSDNRLARDPIEHAQIRILLQGVPVHLCDTGRLYNPDDGDLLSQVIKDGTSKFEVDQTRERTRDTFISKVSRGERIGGKLPYGVVYQQRSKKYVVDSRYQDTVRRVFEMYSLGHGFHAIAKIMRWVKKDGTPNKERVKSIVTNPFYAGYVSMYKVKPKSRLSVQDMSNWVMHPCKEIEPLISYEMWLSCFRLYTQKQKQDAITARKSYRTPFLLAGLLYCTEPAKHENPIPMKTKNRSKTVRDQFGVLQTYGGRVYHCEACKYSVDAQALHHKVLQAIMTTVAPRSQSEWDAIKAELYNKLNEEALTIKTTIGRLQSEIEQHRRLIDEAAKKLQPLVPHSEKYKDSMMILETYRNILKQKSDECQTEKVKLEEKLKRMNQLLTHDVQDIRLDSFHESQLRRLVTNLVQEIHINSSGNLHLQALVDMDKCF